MALKMIEKPSEVVEPSTEPVIGAVDAEVTEELMLLVDGYGAKLKEIAKATKVLKKMQAEVAPLAAELREHGLTFEAEQEVDIAGDDFTVTLSKLPKSVTDIDKAVLLEKIGQDQWNDLTCPGVGDLRKYLTEEELKPILTEERKGNRSIKIVQN